MEKPPESASQSPPNPPAPPNPRSPRARRGAEQWRQCILTQRDSGLSARAFCQRQDIALGSFYAARKRFARAHEQATTTAEFVRLEPLPATSISADRATIRWPNGVRIQCAGHRLGELLAAAMRELN